jgi:hypothetical protein
MRVDSYYDKDLANALLSLINKVVIILELYLILQHNHNFLCENVLYLIS